MDTLCNCHGMIYLDCPNYKATRTHAPKTYQDGLREMMDCACKAVCIGCRQFGFSEEHPQCFLIKRAALDRFGLKEEK